MSRKKILWLVSWYPNSNDRFDGDFIQRHARAAAIYHDVHVIFVSGCEQFQPVDENWNYVTGLTEQVICFKKRKGIIGKLWQARKWERLFKKAVENYIDKSGLPSCIHVHIPWKAGLIGIWMKRRYKIPFILSEHWGIYDRQLPDYFETRSKVFQKLVRNIYKSAGALVTVSHYLGGQVKQLMDKNPDAVIPNVVDTSLFYWKEEKYSRFTFIHVSNMAPVKNAGEILKAFQQVVSETARPDLQLLMIGNRDDHYQKMAAGMGLLNTTVFFRGEIPYQEVAQEMRKSHCFVLFSTSETFSCVTAEALCCGIPVIASNTGALPELVDESNGILVPPGDVPALKSAMLRMISDYAAFPHAPIAAAAAERFGYARVSHDLEALYQAVCHRPLKKN